MDSIPQEPTIEQVITKAMQDTAPMYAAFPILQDWFVKHGVALCAAGELWGVFRSRSFMKAHPDVKKQKVGIFSTLSEALTCALSEVDRLADSQPESGAAE